MKGTWETTSNGGLVLTGGGVIALIGAGVLYTQRKQIAAATSDVLIVAAISTLIITALIVVFVRASRREQAALAEFREQQALTWQAQQEADRAAKLRELEARRPQVTVILDPAAVRGYPPVQPTTVIPAEVER